MITILYMMTLFVHYNEHFAKASDQWLCSTQASERREHDILACGVGQGPTEEEARVNALDNAKAEFSAICDSSYDCANHVICVNPKRTSCIKDNKGNYKCYRLIIFTIGAEYDTASDAVHLGQIRIGMNQKTVYRVLGYPEAVVPRLFGGEQALYSGPMCSVAGESCYLIFDNGKLVAALHFNPKYVGV